MLESMLRTLGAVALCSFLVLPPAQAEDFKVRTATLDNGLVIAVVEDHRAPVVTQMLYYKAGSADEQIGKSGVAHFLEHMMFQGTSTTPGAQFRSTIARFGGRENAFTSSDVTAYHQTVGKEALELVLRLEADRMHNLTITQKEFDSEKEVIKEERRNRYENEPPGQFGEQMQAAQFLSHPYGQPTIGWMHEIDATTREDALAWYKKWYVPNNAILVIAGDTTLEEVVPLARKYYGVIPRGADPQRFRPKEPPQLAERRVLLYDARVRQATFSRTYLAPSVTARDGVAPALSVLSAILSGGTGRLYQALVVDQRVAAGAGAAYSGGTLDATTFGVWAAPPRGGDIVALERAVDAELEKLLRDGVTEEEVTRAKVNVTSGLVFARDNVMGLARRVGNGLSIGQSIEEITNWSQVIESITVAQVNAAAKQALDRRRSVTGIMQPPQGAPATSARPAAVQKEAAL